MTYLNETNFQAPKPIGFGDNGSRQYECSICGDIVHIRPNTFYGRCPSCKATYIDYKPLPHQVEFHKSSAPYRLLMGGYGTGKTTMCVAEVARHVMTVPQGRTLITAPKLQLVKDAILPELEKFLPPWTIKSKRGGNTPNYLLMNGHEIVVYASNDDENLRSLNLTMFYIEEASAIDLEIFHQLQARTRNLAGIFKDKYGTITADYRNGIVSSNPEQGWLVTDFLFYANKIYSSASVDTSSYEMLRKESNPAYEAFLSSTRDNPYLPKNFITNLTVGKAIGWIRKYIDCSLEVKNGAVYPDFHKHIVPDFPIPPNWKRVVGYDRGWRDETAIIFGAIEPKTGVIYVYKEYYVAQQPTSYHADQMKLMLSGLKMYNNPQADPTVLQKNDRDGRSYQEYFFRRSGVYLEPANNSISTGIDKVRDYMYTGKLKFFQSLEHLKAEAYDYAYPDKVFTNEELPIGGKDHLLDAMRYMIMALPQDPFEMTKVSMEYVDPREYDYFWKKLNDESDDDAGLYTLGGGTYGG
jgi:PBSX family phage terminase large subunit